MIISVSSLPMMMMTMMTRTNSIKPLHDDMRRFLFLSYKILIKLANTKKIWYNIYIKSIVYKNLYFETVKHLFIERSKG